MSASAWPGSRLPRALCPTVHAPCQAQSSSTRGRQVKAVPGFSTLAASGLGGHDTPVTQQVSAYELLRQSEQFVLTTGTLTPGSACGHCPHC